MKRVAASKSQVPGTSCGFLPEHNRSLKGVLSTYVQRSLAPEDWSSVRKQAWEDASVEDWKREGESGAS